LLDLERLGSCVGTFPLAALDNPTGAELQSGPEFDSLREAIASDQSLRDLTWRVLRHDLDFVQFHADTPEGEDVCQAFEVDAGEWTYAGMAWGQVGVELSNGLMASSWRLDDTTDPSLFSPNELPVLVRERNCASGKSATGRIEPPLVESTAENVTVTFGVRPLEGAQSCPYNPETPARLQLPFELGERELLDGSTEPPTEIRTV
jgi:hypothetical protein